MGSARRLRSTTDAEVRRTGRIVVATGDPGRAPSGEAAASGKAMRACSAPPASRLARARAARLDDGSNRQRPRRAAVAKPKRAADGRHGARLLRSLRGSDLRAGRGALRGCYRTRAVTRRRGGGCPSECECRARRARGKRPEFRHLQGSPGQMAHTCSNTNAEPLGTSAAVCASQTATGSQPGTARGPARSTAAPPCGCTSRAGSSRCRCGRMAEAFAPPSALPFTDGQAQARVRMSTALTP